MKSPLRILHLEDNPGDAELIQAVLETEGLISHVTRVETQADFFASVEQGGFDIILADYTLPSFDGLSALKITLEKCPDVPFIFVSGTLGEEVAIEALQIGATDYILKERLSRIVPSVHRALRAAKDRAERKQAEALLAGEKRLLEMIAKGNSLSMILDALCRLVEELSKDSLASILLFDGDGNRLWHGAAPSLPKGYIEAIDGGSIGPAAGSCGTAAYRKEPVIVSDIAQDPLWADYRDLALPHGLRACWSTPVLASDGRVLGTFAIYSREPRSPTPQQQNIIEQITNLASIAIERKRAEDALRKSESYLAEAQKLSQTGSFGWNVSTGEIFWSEETYRIAGYALATKPTLELVFQRIHPEDIASVQETLGRGFQGGTDLDFEHRFLMPNGSVKYVHVVAHAVRYEKGNLEYIGAVMDVTQHKRANESLRRSEASLLDAQRLSRTGSWRHDFSSGRVTTSPEAHRMWGIQPEDDAAVTDFFFARMHPEDRPMVERAYGAARLKKTNFESDFRIVLPDGTIKNIHTVGHPILNESGDVVEFVGAAIDVTERKRAEEERQAHLWFLESMDQVNRAIQGTNDLEQMMSDVLDAVISIFNCDRAWLVYPCDPEAASWKVAMEHAQPEFPGLFVLGLDLPVDPEIAKVFQTVRASSSPVRFGPGSEHPLPTEAAKLFSIQSMVAMAIYPKGDRPYMLGLHQCSYPRVWTPQEERLFQEIGRRLEDELTSLLMFRNLGESERKLEEAQRLTHVGYWERDPDTDLITWSDETYRIFGLEPQARVLALAQLSELVHPEDKQIVVEAVAEALRGGPRYDVEYRVVRPNGEVRLVHSRGDVIRDESGRPRRMFGTVQDITERKRAEQRLMAQHTVTQILAEAATLEEVTPKILQAVCECLVWDVGALWSIDKEAGVLRCVEVWHKESVEVPEFEAISRETTFIPGIGLPGRVWFSREPMYIPDVVHDSNFPRAPITGGEVLHAAFGFPILLGGEVLGVMEFFSHEIREPEQELLDMMATIGSQIGQFIERKRAEDALQHAQTALAHVTRVATLGEMTASIAHEINQPLGAIVNSASACLRWLNAQKLEEARGSASRVIAEGHRASEIIGRIRALAKKAPLRKDWLAVNETIHEVIALAHSEVQRNGVALETQLSDDVPVILADRIHLQQVILNLIVNAIEAMSGAGEGPRELWVSSEKVESTDVLIAVRDSGPGLDPKSLDHLFDAFYTTKPHGLGMGLAISRSLIEAHGGRLWATTNAPHGAVFQFTLPIGSETVA